MTPFSTVASVVHALRRAFSARLWGVLIAALLAGSAGQMPAAPPAQPLSATDVVLLDFSATWCGPCRSMAPLMGEISAAGWVVRHVDVDREGDLVRRFGVTGVPCYVLLVKGQEMGRISGATTRGELEQLLAKSREAQTPVSAPTRAPTRALAAGQEKPLGRGDVPGIPLPSLPTHMPLPLESSPRLPPPVAAIVKPTEAVPLPPRGLRDAGPGRGTQAAAAAGTPPQSLAPPLQTLPPAAQAALEARVLAATARLRVEDGEGVSWGTGTVIDCRQGEALILTCGHIFRDSQGKGRIEVDFFGPGGPRGLAGQVISWDLKRDLALVSIFTDVKVEPVRVGGQQRATATGEPVVTMGCNGGQDPTIHYSRVTAVDKYLGPANVQVAGQPVQGRSGGGLFGIDATLIGVCNAADPTDNEGFFAALPTIHEQLDEAGLAFVYRSAYPSGAVADGAAAALPIMPEEMPAVSFDRRDRSGALPTAFTGTSPSEAAEPAAPHASALSPGEKALLDHVRQHDGKAEVICIVRPHGTAQSQSEVFVLQGPGAAATAVPPPGQLVAPVMATQPPANPLR